MLSVIGVSEQVHTEFGAFQKGKLRAISFKMDVNSKSKMQIELDQVLETDSSTHGDIANLLPAEDCRFVFLNLEYMEGLGKRSKAIFILWVPSEAKVKAKMIYASCAVPLKAKLAVTCLSSQGGDAQSIIDYDSLVDKCRQFYD